MFITHTQGITPCLLNDHATHPAFWIESKHSQVHSLLEVTNSLALTQILAAHFAMCSLSLKSCLKIFPYDPTQYIRIQVCRVGFYAESSSTRNVVGCSPNFPSWKPEQELVTLSTNKSSRILKEPWLEGMCTLKALGHGSLMIMIPRFFDESIENSMGYSPKSFGGHKSLV
jgi:hypothetical protein